MKACGKCLRTYTADIFFCPYDGSELSSVPDDTTTLEDPLIGRTFAENYQITARIGEGGMCTVYKAFHLSTQKIQAIKLLRTELASQRQAIKRFQKEILAVSKISHPNVVTISDFGTNEEGYVYLVMEYLEGTTLKHALQTEGPFSIERILYITNQIAEALEAAHNQNVIHRDLKPENIMLLPSEGKEHIKVVDFGIAKVQDSNSGSESTQLTAPNLVMGTPQYMSPEQAKGLELDARSDIYSLGIIVYEMLTGKPPFHGTSSKLILAKQANEAPLSPRRVRPEISAHVERVVLRTLEKNPLRRPQTALGIVRELELAVQLATTMTKSTGDLASYSVCIEEITKTEKKSNNEIGTTVHIDPITTHSLVSSLEAIGNHKRKSKMLSLFLLLSTLLFCVLAWILGFI